MVVGNAGGRWVNHTRLVKFWSYKNLFQKVLGGYGQSPCRVWAALHKKPPPSDKPMAGVGVYCGYKLTKSCFKSSKLLVDRKSVV